MQIQVYVRQVGLSNRTYERPNTNRILFLGLVGELGSLLSECKKTLREGKENRSRIKQKLETEMGDCLWYITAIAMHNDLDIRTDVIRANLDFSLNLDFCTDDIVNEVGLKLDELPDRLPLSFDDFQEIAWITATPDIRENEDELLTSLIRNASHLMRYIATSGLAEKDTTSDRLERLLGNVLWYISVFARKNEITLNDVAQHNYNKTVSRWKIPEAKFTKRLDSRDRPDERFPGEMSFLFQETPNGMVEVTFENQKIRIGDPLDDNVIVEDGYRYHDAFHMAFAAVLTWSPVLRKLLRLGEGEALNKGKAYHRFRSEKDSTEDGARAQIVEEAIAKIVHSHAEEIDPVNLLAEKSVVSTEVLDQIKLFTKKLEVDRVNQWEWELAIIEACKIFVKLKEKNGGRVRLNLANRSIEYEAV